MVKKIIVQIDKLKKTVETLTDGNEQKEKEFVVAVKACIKEFSALLETPEEPKEE